MVPADSFSDVKRALRKEMRRAVSVFVSENDADAVSAGICRRLVSSREFASADIVLSFVGGPLEIRTDVLNETALSSGKTLALPKVVGEGIMEFRVVSPSVPLSAQLCSGAFGIGEPVDGLPVLGFGDLSGKKILVVVPGVAFGKDGTRCGHGKGFYDRYLSALAEKIPAARAVGLCLPCQVVESVPSSPLDVPVSGVFF